MDLHQYGRHPAHLSRQLGGSEIGLSGSSALSATNVLIAVEATAGLELADLGQVLPLAICSAFPVVRADNLTSKLFCSSLVNGFDHLVQALA